MLILASSSPRRRELLKLAGVQFTVQTADIAEEHRKNESPVEFARRLAFEKAAAVGKQNPGSIVLGADTIVVLGQEILGKPRDQADATRMLLALSDRDHEVITAVSLIANGRTSTESEATRVFFSRVTPDEAAKYVATGEPMDKAGAYAIQGMASRWIYRIEGDYYNVMGLPVARVWKMLSRAGAVKS